MAFIKFSEYNGNSNKQMARRMDRKVIKLEAAYGSERQTVMVKRDQELIVRDVMEEVQRAFKIPIGELFIFHKGTNLCDFMNDKLENLGVENNHHIRVTRDTELPKRSPRTQNVRSNSITSSQPQAMTDAAAFFRDRSPQQQMPNIESNQKGNVTSRSQAGGDVLKVYVSYGSEREYLLVYGKKPITIRDLKFEVNRVFKITPEQQCIVFKGYNLHDYVDEAPLEAFGIENNSPIYLWPKGNYVPQDVRLPRSLSPTNQIADIFSPRTQVPALNNRWPNEVSTEVIKLEVQHGSDRHQIILKGQFKTLTVLDLQNELERVTAVPVRDQRLFFRAQELHSAPFKTIKECEIENNNVIRLVGEPAKVRYSNYFGRINANGLNQTYPPGNYQPQQQQPLQPGYVPQFSNQQQQQQQQFPQQTFNDQPNFGQNSNTANNTNYVAAGGQRYMNSLRN